jgi:hypothetical protein
MLLQSNSTSLDDFVVEDQVGLDRVESQKLLAFEQILEVLLAVFGKRFCIDVGHHVSDVVVLLQNRGNSRFDIFIALDQLQLFLKYRRAKVTDILNFFLQVHQLKGS